MYCMATKKKPKLAKNRNVMPTEPVAKSGLPNKRTSRSGCLPTQFEQRETTASATPRTCNPRRSDCVHPRTGASIDTEHENGNGAADEHRADPVDGRGALVTRGTNGQVHTMSADTRDRERVEDRLPREEAQQQPCPHEPEDRCRNSQSLPIFRRPCCVRSWGTRRSAVTASRA